MFEAFIRNHEYNFIKKQVGIFQHALRTNPDPKILESVRDGAEAKILELFPAATEAQKEMLGRFTALKTTEDFQKYVKDLELYLVGFPQITVKQIQKLFPKNKKLKLPDLVNIDFRFVTYLSWMDISTNKLFMVYHQNGQFLGIEGRYTPTNKKSYCFVCNRFEELVLYSAVSKTKPAKASSDYYKAIGNYLCMNGHDCNKNIADVASLERFIHVVIG
ncbi:FusB/FusC family EF-G-binding protein [Paenibacillus paridis]|uniref:FusB/FusC family EF-G-binding protein n=1 Tax=Paenibacillus paridis TaxID=2583376 RepID=UPI001120614E|nr:FusB/FusC family EF-G-binding protein [Paenibacillus paridis]